MSTEFEPVNDLKFAEEWKKPWARNISLANGETATVHIQIDLNRTTATTTATTTESTYWVEWIPDENGRYMGVYHNI